MTPKERLERFAGEALSHANFTLPDEAIAKRCFDIAEAMVAESDRRADEITDKAEPKATFSSWHHCPR